MLDKKIKSVGIVVSLSILFGCGGGGSGGASISPESITLVKVPMSELQADADFTFSNNNQVKVNIDANNLFTEDNQVGERAYISIYRDYTLLPSGEFYPDASSRVLAGDVTGGVFNNSFVALNDQPSYLVEVWFYNGEKPIREEITLIENKLTL